MTLNLYPSGLHIVNIFLLYRRGNMMDAVSIRAQGKGAKITILVIGLAAVALVAQYAWVMLTMDPAALDLPADRAQYFRVIGYALAFECVVGVAAIVLALIDRGKLGQGLYLAATALNVTVFLGVWGFVVMEKASPVLRNVAVSQFLQLISCLVLVSVIDAFLFKRAKSLGPLRWGKMTVRSQYALLLLTFVITMNMGLMGFIRSGLRGDWHIFGVMRDTSQWAHTPSNFVMTQQVAGAVLLFMIGCAFMFWLGGIATQKPED